MASASSHIAIPLALSSASLRKAIPWRLLALGMFLSVAPDLDALAFKFGIPYESPWGHRGFTHSLAFAFGVSAVCAWGAGQLRAGPLVVFLFSFLSMSSHGLLDALTDGGLGVAFFWPFNNERYFLPWQVIEVSPISIGRFFTARGWSVIKSELLYIWLPSVILGLTVWLGQKLLQLLRSLK